MNSLKNLISKYGKPEALIDHWDEKAQKMAIWGFDEIFIHNTDGCYLNGVKIDGDPLQICYNILEDWKHDSSLLSHAMGYISYDMKNQLFPHLKLKELDNQTLMWFGKPKMIKEFNIDSSARKITNSQLNLIQEIPDIKFYDENIKKIKSYLKNGDSYQINYSNPREYSYKGSVFDLYMDLRQSAKPTNGFYLDTGDEKLLSASPEKFFKVNNNVISTYPIKGTIKRSKNPIEDQKLYKKLENSEFAFK